jgi:hypothetical protein
MITPTTETQLELRARVQTMKSARLISLAKLPIASFQLASFHHDFAVLPNGHLIRGRRAPRQITFGGLTIGAELDWAIINTLMRAISEQIKLSERRRGKRITTPRTLTTGSRIDQGESAERQSILVVLRAVNELWHSQTAILQQLSTAAAVPLRLRRA